jgi:hypothetical protein
MYNRMSFKKPFLNKPLPNTGRNTSVIFFSCVSFTLNPDAHLTPEADPFDLICVMFPLTEASMSL